MKALLALERIREWRTRLKKKWYKENSLEGRKPKSFLKTNKCSQLWVMANAQKKGERKKLEPKKQINEQVRKVRDKVKVMREEKGDQVRAK